jgi:hypothetical protein
MARIAKNLYLDPEAIEHAEHYGRLHGTTLSRLVSDYLRALPLEGAKRDLPPSVRRLIGAGVPGGADPSVADIDTYRQHLMDRYGQR